MEQTQLDTLSAMLPVDGTVYRSANPADRWVQCVLVNADGTLYMLGHSMLGIIEMGPMNPQEQYQTLEEATSALEGIAAIFGWRKEENETCEEKSPAQSS